MKIKTYRALTIAEALANIKKELGPEAFILGQKEIPPKRRFGVLGKTTFEVTAGVDFTQAGVSIAPATETGESPDLVSLTYTPPAKSTGPKVVSRVTEQNTVLDEIRELRRFVETAAAQSQPRNVIVQASRRFSSASAREVFADLLNCGFNPGFAGSCLDDASLPQKSSANAGTENLKDRVLGNLIARIQTDPGILPTSSVGHPQIIALVGPTGVGKTTTVAKLAARAALEFRLKVALITNDTYRIAAAEQLRTYAEIIGIPLQVVNGTQEMTDAIRSFADRDVILMDTAGRSHRELAHQKQWSRYFSKAVDVKKALVLSATTKEDDLESAISKFQSFDPNWIIFTKLDDTEVHGPMISALVRSGKPLAYVTVGQDVPQDIAQPAADQIARLALGRGDRRIWEQFLTGCRSAEILSESEEREEEVQVGR